MSTETIVVRPLLPTDSLVEMTELLHQSYASLAAMGLRYMATHQGVDVTANRVAQGECFVALSGGAICGTILFRNSERTKGCDWYDRPDVASFGQFAVQPALQAKGLGRRLVGLVEERAALSGAAELALDTAEPATHLVGWYGRLGYRFIEHRQWSHTNYRSVIMSKTLRAV
ncbi:MAG: GNAT family N-acetyltransferase [Devosia sp.]